MVYINKPLFNDLDKINDAIAQKLYVEAINKVNFNKIKCCQKKGGSFIVHGYYSRSFRLGECIIRIRITRIKCEYCGKTHAVFFNDVIPYSSFNALECHKILMNIIEPSFSYEVIEKIKRIKRIILKRLELLGLSIREKIEVLIKEAVHFIYVHFLQIHRGTIVDYLFENG